MPNIDTLSIQFNANGTEKAIKNIKSMGYAVRNLAQSVKGIDASKLSAFTSSMETLKKSVPTEAQTNRMVAFGEAVKSLSSVIGSANIGGFSKDMSTLGDAVNTFKKSSVNSITNAVTAMQNLQTQTQATANTISNAIPESSVSIERGNRANESLSQTKELIASLDKVQIKATGIQGVLQKMGMVVPTKKFKDLEENAEKIRQKYDELRAALQKGLNEGSIESGGTEYRKKMAELDALRNKYDELIQKQKELAIEGKGFAFNSNISKAFQGASNSVKGVKQAFNGITSIVQSANKGISALISKIRSIGSTSKKASQDTTSLNKVVKKLGNELFRVSKMLKLMIVRKALRAVIAEVSNGFQSLAIHSDEFNNAMSSLINGSKTLGYSFSAMVSPLINALAPAIVYVINLLTRLLNVFNQVMSALTGASSWNKAKAFTDSWRDSIEGAGSAAKKTANELKKTVLGFDELNQLQDNKDSSSGGGGIADMFETLPIESKWKDLANKIKAIAQRLFNPIKKAWNKVGDFVKKSWKYAMDEVLKLGKSVARDFLKVWEQEATQKIFENIFESVGWIGVAVGNLAKRFREAWDENKTGLHILEAIRDIILIVTNHIKDMAKATAEWADNLDFKPLLTSIQRWLESLKPAMDAVMGILEDFYNQVVLKFTKWVIESGLPELIDVFKRFNEEVDWDGLRSKLAELWKHLEPFMETVGEGLIIFIERIADAVANFVNSEAFENFLTKIEEWMDNVDPEDVADGLETIAKAIIAFKLGSAVVKGLSTVAKFLSLIKSLAPMLKLAVVISVAYEGLQAGLDLGEKLFPDEKELYEHYKGIVGTWNLIKDSVTAIVDYIYDYFTSAWDMATSYAKIVITEVNAIIGDGSWEEVGKAFDDWQQAVDKFRSLNYMSDYSTDDYVNEWIKAKNSIEDTTGTLENFKEKASKAFEGANKESKNFGTKVKELKEDTDKADTSTTSFTQKIADLKAKASEAETGISNLNEKGKSFGTTVKELASANDSAKTSNDTLTESFGRIYKALMDTTKKTDEMNVAWKESDVAIAQTTLSMDGSVKELQKGVDDASEDIKKQSKAITDSFSKDKWTFSGVAEGLSKTFKDAKDAIGKIWNSIAKTLNGEFGIGSTKFKIKLPTFATGGFPEDGLFLASHHELVGSFSNGKTAVANNQQIIAGIETGVYSAMSKAMAQNNGGSQYISNEIIVDGDVIARSVSKAQERQGRRFSPSMA